MNKKHILIFIILNLTMAPINGNNTLSFPYNSIEVLPFNPHNWYGNDLYIEKIIKHYKVKTIVELGSWLGGSARHMAGLIPEDGIVYAIDNWHGSVPPAELAVEKQICDIDKMYLQFLSNTIHAKLTHKIIPIKMDVVEASKVFTNLKPNLIYVDASHDEDSVYKDICSWWPFVKDSGFMCGDDWYYGPGVRKAVSRFAAENNLQIYSQNNFWMFIKPNEMNIFES